jgi:DNA gyrase/topoisomerase IV subunit A
MNDVTKFFSDSKEENMKDSIYPISNVAKNEWRSFALYTVESRAIPNMIDGLKPVNRMTLYSCIENASKEYKKVSAIAGVISDYGYNHGETSAASALQLMAAEWGNNICLVEGRGSFGSRLIPSPAAPRYTYVRLHQNFNLYIKDLDLAPEHSDPEHIPPAYYIPVIPLVLVNGSKGIATGFATDILPRSLEGVTRACKEYITTGKIKNRVPVKFPQFNGRVEYNEEENRFYSYGNFERRGKTVLVISEVPYGIDRETYVSFLDKLEENGVISSYEDLCDKDGFCFEVKLKQSTSANWADEKIYKEFRLVKTYTENLTVIDQNGKLKEYSDERDLIVDFCNFRNGILQRRIDLRKAEFFEEGRWLKVKMQFIQKVIGGKIDFKNKKKNDVSKQIMSCTDALESDIERLLKINLLSLTDEMVQELQKQIIEIDKSYNFWSNTTTKEQFLSDLKSL